jgi:8-oxo-dGTP pyrophosphatase MutT (NUDIX family)
MTGAAFEDRLRAAGDWLGASCVARWRDAGFVFAGEVRDDALLLSGVGGKVEPGETFGQAMRREFAEETGCAIGATVRPPRVRHLTALAEAEDVPDGAAALVAERPVAHPTGGTLWIAVFVGLLAAAPRPVEKVAHFVVVPPSSGWPALAELRVDQLGLVVGDAVEPATAVLPASVRRVRAEHTGAAVLATRGLLAEWWAATGAGPVGLRP